MAARALIFALVLLVAGGLIVAGVALLAPPVALIVAGVLLGPWAWLVLGDTPEREA